MARAGDPLLLLRDPYLDNNKLLVMLAGAGVPGDASNSNRFGCLPMNGSIISQPE